MEGELINQLRPAQLDVRKGDNVCSKWKDFKEEFELYITAIGYEAKSDAQKVAIFLSCIGKSAREDFSTFEFGTTTVSGAEISDSKILAKVIAKFEAFYVPKTNRTFERSRFMACKQETDENIDAFLTRIKVRAETCEFAAIKESMICDKLVCGVKDLHLREKLFSKNDLLLADAVKYAKAAEYVEEHKSAITGETVVNTVKKSKTVNKFQSNKVNKPYRKCRYCGDPHVFIKEKCPAYGKECSKCGNMNHFASMCKSKAKKGKKHVFSMVEMESSESEYSSDDKYLGSLTIESINSSSSDWILPVKVNGTILPMKLDTGAQANVMSKQDFYKLPILQKPKLHHTTQKLKGYNGNDIKVLGKVILKIECNENGIQHNVLFYVVDGHDKTLLSRNACVRLNLIKLVHKMDEENVNYQWVYDEYKDLFDGTLGELQGEYKIELQDDAVPVVHPCRKIPLQMWEKLKAKIDQLENDGIISKIEEPTDWVNSLVVATKKNGDLRLCLDPRDLNKYIRRQHFKLPTREEVMARFHKAKVFSKIDAADGFFQLKLDEQSRKLTTFNTPFARYCYNRLPNGISSAPEVFHKKISNLFENEKQIDTSMDDAIIWGEETEDHDKQLRKVLNIIRESGLKLNKNKCQFGVSEVLFLGDVLTSQGVKPDPAKVSAIENMPTPSNKKELQRFMGMVNYVAKWMPDLSTRTKPIRELLCDKNEWKWEYEQQHSFNEVKRMLTESPVLKFYDPNLPIKVSTDACKDGLGAVLLQLHEGLWKPVAYASRSLTDAETRYAMIEKELLGMVFGCERFHQYIYGTTITAETDHKPIVNLFQKSLNDCPLRVQRLMLRLQNYNLEVVYTPGKFLAVSDALSRAAEPYQSSGELEKEIELHVRSVLQAMPASDNRMKEIQAETLRCEEMTKLMEMILNGWPDSKQDCEMIVMPYWNIRGELSTADGFIFKGSRIVIPHSMRPNLLAHLHKGHLGIEKIRRRARESVFWPGINMDITHKCKLCSTCEKFQAKQHREPIITPEIPQWPFQLVASDLFSYKENEYLIVVDYYSSYFEITNLRKATTSRAVIEALKNIFARFGVPEKVISDNGPQFDSQEYKLFAEQWNFKISTSSPHHPSGNGKAENAVKIAKRMVKKAIDSGEDLTEALLAYRSSPLENGRTPAELIFGREIKSFVPTRSFKLKPKDSEEVVEKKIVQKKKINRIVDERSRKLELLKAGDMVRIRDPVSSIWQKTGTVLKQVQDRSYNIKTDDGGLYRRNRRDIRLAETENLTDLQMRGTEDNSGTVDIDSKGGNGDDDTIPMESTGEPLTGNKAIGLRRSNRERKVTNRLIEEM